MSPSAENAPAAAAPGCAHAEPPGPPPRDRPPARRERKQRERREIDAALRCKHPHLIRHPDTTMRRIPGAAANMLMRSDPQRASARLSARRDVEPLGATRKYPD